MTSRVLGIVAEYNPLHNGHLYQLREAVKLSGAQVVVVVMSGNFVQRGEPAIFDKWQRAELALEHGIDLVVELPAKFAVQPAHVFASGAIQVLKALGCDTIAFGAEHPDLDFARLVASQPQGQSDQFKKFDATYATLFHDYLLAETGVSLKASNDILAFAYAMANQRLEQPMALLPIQRTSHNHQASEIQVNQSIASGSAIRQALENEDFEAVRVVVPAQTFKAVESFKNVSWADYWPYLKYQLVSTPLEPLQSLYQMTEGIEHRLKRSALHAKDFESFLRAVKTKRYTYARLQRLCVTVLWQLRAADLATKLDYIRILGFNQRGQSWLNKRKKQTEIPLITKVTQEWIDGPYRLDARAGDLRELISGLNQDVLRHPIVVNYQGNRLDMQND